MTAMHHVPSAAAVRFEELKTPEELEAEDRENLPSGWWLLPAVILGICFWVAVFWFLIF
ncbi:hypothetical protein LA304_06110 [Celeribacter sp. ASW11-22]|nr:hypothetical protein [Celeribacter litoreus]